MIYNQFNRMCFAKMCTHWSTLTNGHHFYHGIRAQQCLYGMEKLRKANSQLFLKGKETRSVTTNQSNNQQTKFDLSVPPGLFVEVEGMNIHYEKVGTGSETIFMLTPSLGSTRLDYHYQLEGLDPNRFTLIAWDAPGYGFSRPPDRQFPIDMFNRDAYWARKFLKQLGVEKANILGFCSGANSAMIFAADYPEMVKKLVLIEGYSVYTDKDLLYFERMRELRNWNRNASINSITVYGEEYLEKKMNGLLDFGIRLRNTKNGNVCNEKLSSIQCPTLLLYSKDSRAVSQEQAFHLLNCIKDARLILLDKGKHLVLLERPNLVNKIVTDFILENDTDDQV